MSRHATTSTIGAHSRRVIIRVTDLRDCAKVYALCDAGHGFRETRRTSVFAPRSGQSSTARRDQASHFWDADFQLLSSPKRNRMHVTLRLLKARLLENHCQSCGIRDWRGRTLRPHPAHMNGIGYDDRPKNFRLLCPNCHSQTPTHRGRNLRLRRLQEPAPVV
jgi:hypothetical protein